MRFNIKQAKQRAMLAGLWIWVLILYQPILDAISFWTADLRMGSTITLGLRMLVLAVTVLLAFWLSERRRAYWIMAAVLAVYWAAHFVVCKSVGYDDPVSDLTNFIRVAQLPVFTLALITLLKTAGSVPDRIENALAAALGLIALITLLAVVTGTNNPTYPKWGIGVCAWFALPNSQSAIYGVLTLITVSSAIRRQKPVLAILCCAVGFALLYLLGTRLAYAEIFAIALAVAVSAVLTRTGSRRIWITVITLAILCGALYPVSPMYRNRQAYAHSADIQQEDAEDTLEETPPPPQEYDWLPDAEESLDLLYRQYQPLMVRRFGLEPVKAAFGYTDDVQKLGDLRLCKILFCRLAMQELPFASRLFGFELSTTVVEDGIFDVENDFHGMYFLYGIVGLVMMIAFLGYFALRALLRMLREPKRYLTMPVCAYSASALILVINAYFSASVLRRPNASVYLSITLAVLWLLTEKSRVDTDKENV